jgi:hypothetical protein
MAVLPRIICLNLGSQTIGLAAELEHRFNNRGNKFLFRDTLLKLVKAEKLRYRELTKAA